MNNITHFTKRFLLGMKVGSNIFQKIKASFGLVFISFVNELEFEIKIFNRKNRVYLRNGSDAAVMVGVFFDEEYSLSRDFYPKKILDLGANIGMASLYFSLRDPSCSIIAVEPDPNNFFLLRKNISGKNVQIIEGAVDKSPGIKEFYTVNGQGMSSSFTKRFSAIPIKVQAYSIDSLLSKIGWQDVDLIKFDVEGAEFGLFENFRPGVSKAFIGEYHADLTRRSVNDFITLFPLHKSEIKTVNQNRFITKFFK